MRGKKVFSPFFQFPKEKRLMQPWASSCICSHPSSHCPITKPRQISPILRFQRQQFPRSFSQAGSWQQEGELHPQPRERAQRFTHARSSRSSGCLSSAEATSAITCSVPGISEANHKAQSCRKPGFAHSRLAEALTLEVGYREARHDLVAHSLQVCLCP